MNKYHIWSFGLSAIGTQFLVNAMPSLLEGSLLLFGVLLINTAFVVGSWGIEDRKNRSHSEVEKWNLHS